MWKEILTALTCAVDLHSGATKMKKELQSENTLHVKNGRSMSDGLDICR